MKRGHFLDEIELMKQISKGNNPYVVKMIGCVTTFEPFFLITEYMQYGDLLSYLRNTKDMVSID